MFAATPLLIAALAAPTLGERVGWRRWVAIGIGFAGVLVILRPGTGVFSAYAAVALVACANFAIYSLLTRSVARDDDPTTSFLWTGIVGLVVLTPIGLWRWQAMSGGDWAVMAPLRALAALDGRAIRREPDAARLWPRAARRGTPRRSEAVRHVSRCGRCSGPGPLPPRARPRRCEVRKA